MNEKPAKRIGRPKSDKGSDYANRSVLIGASLLRTIAKQGGAASLPEIAQASGLLLARTHRYLVSLVKSGLLDYASVSGRYNLGSLVLELGLTALERIDAVRLGSDALRRLTERLNVTSTLSVWGSNGTTIIKCEMARTNRINQIREGTNLALLTSATGRIFFTYLPRRDTQEFLNRQNTRSPSGTSDGGLSREELEALRADIRRVGIAKNSGDTNRDALAAPVFNYEGKLAMVITIVADLNSMDMELDGHTARELRNTAEELSRQLGARIGLTKASSAA
jgi:DNA-binding IclR family transcriptional regulator